MHPKKKWGQNFLSQSHYRDRILEWAAVGPQDCVLEIGPGMGALTTGLLATKASVVAVEIDPELCEHLQQRYQHDSKFHLVQQDILAWTAQDWQQAFPQPYKVVANLPYYLTSPFLFQLAMVRHHTTSATLMIQKEVALRFRASPAERADYGPLSIMRQMCFDLEIAFWVPPSAFSPPPKVDSAVIHLVPKKSEFSVEVESLFFEWVQSIFMGRRKTILNNLKRASPEAFLLEQASFTEQFQKRRPETLEQEEWIQLFKQVHPHHVRDGITS